MTCTHPSPLRALLATLLVVSLALGGCTTLRPIGNVGRTAPVAVGDWLKVTYTDGRSIELIVDEVRSDSWVGHNGDVRIEVQRVDAASVERREISAAKTAGLVLIIILGTWLYAAFLVAS